MNIPLIKFRHRWKFPIRKMFQCAVFTCNPLNYYKPIYNKFRNDTNPRVTSEKFIALNK